MTSNNMESGRLGKYCMIEEHLVIGHVFSSRVEHNQWLVLFMVPFLHKTSKRYLHCHLEAVAAFCKIWNEKLPQRFLSRIIKCSHADASKRSLWHKFYNWFPFFLEKYMFFDYNTLWSVITFCTLNKLHHILYRKTFDWWYYWCFLLFIICKFR